MGTDEIHTSKQFKKKIHSVCVYWWDTRQCQQFKKTNNPFCVCTDEIHVTVNNIKTMSTAQKCFRGRICVALNIKYVS